MNALSVVPSPLPASRPESPGLPAAPATGAGVSSQSAGTPAPPDLLSAAVTLALIVQDAVDQAGNPYIAGAAVLRAVRTVMYAEANRVARARTIARMGSRVRVVLSEDGVGADVPVCSTEGEACR